MFNIFGIKRHGVFYAPDAGTVVNVTTNGTTGTVNAYNGQYDASVATSNSMTPGMKVYYDTALLENARPKLIFGQLGKKQNLPKNHGESVEWRRWNTFDKALTPLQEGVIPAGHPFGQTSMSVSIKQYGDYTAISDRLEYHHVDNVIQGAAEGMGAAGGETADTLIRNELATGTNVIYADTLDADGVPTSTPVGRYQMASGNNRLTPDVINKAYTFLKKQKAPYFEGNKYVAVIHPSVAYDLRSNKDWIEVHKYSATREIFEGEIGELHGVRFIENTEAPIFNGGNLFGDTANLTVSAYTTADSTQSAQFGAVSRVKITLKETLTDEIAAALVGRRVHFFDKSANAFAGTGEIVGATVSGKYVWLAEEAPVALAGTSGSEDTLWPGEGGASKDGPCAVYGTLFFGKDAFGVVDPEGMGMEMIIKDASQIGGPLNQFSTVGYKFENAVKILYQERMVRVESCSAYSTVDEAN